VQQWLNDLASQQAQPELRGQTTRSMVGQTWSVSRTTPAGVRKIVFTIQAPSEDSECLVVVRETSDAALIEAIAQEFQLTAREAEVMYWVVKGKINRDIGEILGSSPMTVKKHLERVFSKLGVETRTAAAGMVMARLRLSHPQVES
jgi:DNA-binding CsgD family transcriptional regulator